MRNLYNKLIGKVGVDRVAHFAVFGLAVALPALFGWWAMLVAFVLMGVLAWLKEAKLDEAPDAWDFYAGILGGVLVVIVKCLTFI